MGKNRGSLSVFMDFL